ncbi:hypothetical protein KEM52_004305, partial [Ascosphaera acerosa]
MQVDNERIVLERVAHLLHQPLSADEGAPPYDAPVATLLRLRAMRLLTHLVTAFPDAEPGSPRCGDSDAAAEPVSPRGRDSDAAADADADADLAPSPQATSARLRVNHRVARLVLQHPYVLPHIFCAIHDASARLHAHPPDAKRHAELINGLVRLAYSVTHARLSPAGGDSADAIGASANAAAAAAAPVPFDVLGKLRAAPSIRHIDGYARSAVRGVAARFVVAMARIAFAERLVLDADLTDETMA